MCIRDSVLDGCPTENQLELWRRGIILSQRKTLPATVKVLESKATQTLIEIVLTEGRNRQIRRVAEYFGYTVVSLHRIAISSITLQNATGKSLFLGDHRHLSTAEVKFLQKMLKKTADLRPTRKISITKKNRL